MFKVHNKVSHVFLLSSPLTLAFLLLTLNQQLFAGKKIELLQSWTKYCIQIQGINKNGPSIECFTADFSQFCGATVKICSFGGRLSICHQFQAFQRFNVHQALKGKSLDNSWQQVYSLFDENNLVPEIFCSRLQLFFVEIQIFSRLFSYRLLLYSRYHELLQKKHPTEISISDIRSMHLCFPIIFYLSVLATVFP